MIPVSPPATGLGTPEGYEMKYRLLPIPKPADRLPLTLEPIEE